MSVHEEDRGEWCYRFEMSLSLSLSLIVVNIFKLISISTSFLLTDDLFQSDPGRKDNNEKNDNEIVWVEFY
jgi:hypothetical protein